MRVVSWKSGNAIAVCVMTIVLGQFAAPVTGSARAIQEQDQPNPEQTAPPAAQPTPKPAPQEGPRRPSLPPGPNVRVEITITDQAGTDAPVKKTLSVIAADRHNGSVRSKVTVVVPGPPQSGPVTTGPRYEELPLNVDVRAEVMENGLIRTHLILNYETFSASRETGAAVRSVVTGNQTMMLENGKPLIVSQSADAATDRKVMLELKATILR
jgi:hypothetical protein